ncbi:RNA-directed DNA polymerase from mobile element jockey-like [Brachionus plicatilis]|uniref:RNA-directed DNA polymerase from mobile element jockey-like n=1 Tax=Brachionus plicatilis TaxID=10195 RepID=A0A3M7ST88_BRAPC|nr:RNA-directed DNA polymerase from mobile element jockey-like [Brachionus plicatilis]
MLTLIQDKQCGVLLFNIFIDDIIDKITTAYKGLFADDLSIWTLSPKIEGAESNLKQAIKEVETWSMHWRMKLSAAKTVCTIFTRLNEKGNPKLDIILHGMKIKHETSLSCWGLSWTRTFYDHIKEITNKPRALELIADLRCRRFYTLLV